MASLSFSQAAARETLTTPNTLVMASSRVHVTLVRLGSTYTVDWMQWTRKGPKGRSRRCMVPQELLLKSPTVQALEDNLSLFE